MVLYCLHIPKASRIHVSVHRGKTSILGQKQGVLFVFRYPTPPLPGIACAKEPKRTIFRDQSCRIKPNGTQYADFIKLKTWFFLNKTWFGAGTASLRGGLRRRNDPNESPLYTRAAAPPLLMVKPRQYPSEKNPDRESKIPSASSPLGYAICHTLGGKNRGSFRFQVSRYVPASNLLPKSVH